MGDLRAQDGSKPQEVPRLGRQETPRERPKAPEVKPKRKPEDPRNARIRLSRAWGKNGGVQHKVEDMWSS